MYNSPIAPAGTAFIALSRTRYVVFGIGRPSSGSVHVSGSHTHRLVQTVASVGPYTFTTRKRLAHHRTTSGGAGSPPITIVRSVAGIAPGSSTRSSAGGR